LLLLLLPVPEAALLATTATARPSPARDESDAVSCRDVDVDAPIDCLPAVYLKLKLDRCTKAQHTAAIYIYIWLHCRKKNQKVG
jgi:hypothetical protein